MKRRDFLKMSSQGVLGTSMLLSGSMAVSAQDTPNVKKTRVAMIGVGGRGQGHTHTLSSLFPDVEIVAVCDLYKDRAVSAAAVCAKNQTLEPKIYADGPDRWKELLEKETLDAVIISTYWDSHAAISEAALKKGIYVGCEVPIALSVDECWKLVEASEKYKTPCMMLENWSFRQDNLALLNMIRAGLFGDMIHSHCAHSHDCIDHWFFSSNDGKDRWPAEYLRKYNRDYYPTHSLGPVLSWLDINVGDRFTEIYSTASASLGINAMMKRKFGPDHPSATETFKQGDIVTSTLKTAMGKTVVINLDMQLPRPYSNRWLVQGTLGVYDEEKGSIYLTGQSPKYHEWEPWTPYQEKYNHQYWKSAAQGGHGGTDYIELRLLMDSVQNKSEAPLDVYDSVVMSAVVELSGLSIAKNQPVEFPDFTKGAWKTRKPYFGVTG
ncbi:MAG: Gfo/Idh/MocA family oxidoreductase [Planctomycetaceae bacterium]|nr:Gfo/Idh/MocA family oxidoreductase [Planctomycetaceae bacterium]